MASPYSTPPNLPVVVTRYEPSMPAEATGTLFVLASGFGIGGAPEGVLAAAALRCIGGQMQCRLVIDNEALRERTRKMGIKDPKKKYEIEDMVRGDCLFSATGVTDGAMLRGVKFHKDIIETETVVMRSVTGTVRRIIAEHRQLEKFHLD